MTTKKGMLAVAIVGSITCGKAYAQISSEAFFPSGSIAVAETGADELLEINGSSWTFYLDSAERKCYIDFETISVNLDEIEVKDATGNRIHAAQVWNLPVDTIYEVDMKGWKPGRYFVSLHSITGVIRKELYLAD
ncbi:MAG: hypothetical protein RLY31_529 [Bacteroidota bacterium]|jgi:hypothetical protein